MSDREDRSNGIPLSSTALGKQKENRIIVPTITVFLPGGLRRTLRKSPQANLLLGWFFKAGPFDDKLMIVVSGLVSRQQMINSHFRLAEDTENQEVCIIGACEIDGSRSSQEGNSNTGGKTTQLWLDVKFLSDRETVQRQKASKGAVVVGMQASIGLEQATQCAINVIVFNTPAADRMKYLSLEPMILPTASTAGVLDRARNSHESGKQQHLQHKLEALVRLDPMRHQDIISQYQRNKGPGQGFRRAVELLNQCSYLNERLSRSSLTSKANGHTESGHTLFFAVFTSLAEVVRSCCTRAKSIMQFPVRGVRLTDISATARQLDLRLGQFVVWPSLGYQLRTQRRKDQEPVSNLAPRYIALYNGVWLVINDVILGQAAGLWICDNHKGIARLLSRSLSPILAGSLMTTLDWLDDWPAGLKLNTQLSHFFRDMFVGLTTAWNDTCLSPVSKGSDALAQLVYIIGMSSRLMGLTILLSITIDILQLLTLHWTLFYRIQQAIFSFFCSSIVSLFHLFRGKKRNPLRKNRIDQATYELDQLLLGTIFFTLLVFLWLTVAIYYLQFSLLRLALVGIVLVIQTGLAFLNHLPLFALMLRIKEPDRLPGGVELRRIQVDPLDNPLNCSYYELHNTPLGLQDIFRGYNGHLQAIRDLPGLLWSVIIGRKF